MAGVTPKPTSSETMAPSAAPNPNCRTGAISLTISDAKPMAVVNIARKQGFQAILRARPQSVFAVAVSEIVGKMNGGCECKDHNHDR